MWNCCPEWALRHRDALGSIIILVMAIIFLERLVAWQDPQGTLYFAIAITLVTAALIALIGFGKRK